MCVQPKCPKPAPMHMVGPQTVGTKGSSPLPPRRLFYPSCCRHLSLRLVFHPRLSLLCLFSNLSSLPLSCFLIVGRMRWGRVGEATTLLARVERQRCVLPLVLCRVERSSPCPSTEWPVTSCVACCAPAQIRTRRHIARASHKEDARATANLSNCIHRYMTLVSLHGSGEMLV